MLVTDIMQGVWQMCLNACVMKTEGGMPCSKDSWPHPTQALCRRPRSVLAVQRLWYLRMLQKKTAI